MEISTRTIGDKYSIAYKPEKLHPGLANLVERITDQPPDSVLQVKSLCSEEKGLSFQGLESQSVELRWASAGTLESQIDVLCKTFGTALAFLLTRHLEELISAQRTEGFRQRANRINNNELSKPIEHVMLAKVICPDQNNAEVNGVYEACLIYCCLSIKMDGYKLVPFSQGNPDGKLTVQKATFMVDNQRLRRNLIPLFFTSLLQTFKLLFSMMRYF